MTVSLYKISAALLVLLVLAVTAVGLAGTLQILFPIVALGIGLYALVRSPTRDYLQFTMMLWMFAPFVRRLADWQGGRSNFSLIILTPLLVSMLSFLVLPNRWPRNQAGPLYSMLMYIGVVTWGALISLGNGQIIPVIYAYMTWLAPAGLAMLILSRSDRLEEIGLTLERVIILGSAIMAVYGLVQFAIVPPWDKAWVLDSGMASVGSPTPFEIRIFSTSNAPGVLGIVLMCALLAIFNRPSLYHVVAGAVIGLAFGLTLVRSAWGGLVLGLLLFLAIGQVRVKLRVGLFGAALLAVAIPLLAVSPAFKMISERAETVTSLDEDTSFNARADMAARMLEDIPSLALGHGIGASGLAANLENGGEGKTVVIDNGLLDLLFQFGLVGFVLFGILGYWGLTLVRALRLAPMVATSSVIAIAILAMMIFANVLPTPNGNFLFPFMAVALASAARKRPSSMSAARLPDQAAA